MALDLQKNRQEQVEAEFKALTESRALPEKQLDFKFDGAQSFGAAVAEPDV